MAALDAPPLRQGLPHHRPDLRGFGDTDAPPSATSYTVLHIVGDLVALLDALGLEQVFLVGHDWGTIIAWWFCLLRPDRIKALVNTSMVFQPRNPVVKPVEGFRDIFVDGFYVCKFQEPGKAEADSTDTVTLMKTFLSSRDPKPPVIPKEIDMDVFIARKKKHVETEICISIGFGFLS
ncbi:hypothetical protein BUALT_Bualt03G0230100 [Buddleja alternifolia]|uniref:AB hydrolase-1 domain-containing protein n=1 Tax=Buddleja alternifolia TaxID=168488 RepID=A0AAV6Y0E2_9LAMI|nr:hypothetical protein BUALT_Bualt03G0230100 [Buddleja alternifolia]